jgi:hypothetical protein
MILPPINMTVFITLAYMGTISSLTCTSWYKNLYNHFLPYHWFHEIELNLLGLEHESDSLPTKEASKKKPHIILVRLPFRFH